VALLLLTVLVLGIVWQVDRGEGGSKADLPSVRLLELPQRRAFAALRGVTQSVPLALRASLRTARNRTIRTLRLNTARYVSADTGLWVVNGRSDTCIVQAHGGAVACASKGDFLEEGVALGVVDLGPPPDRRPRKFIVAGIVPNQVVAVDVEVGKRMRRLVVRDNSYSLRSSAPIIVKRFER
jgi:hypothetical protein